jgi:hypothetical protein
MKRKVFIKKSALLASVGLVSPSFSSITNYSKIIGANDSIRIGTPL